MQQFIETSAAAIPIVFHCSAHTHFASCFVSKAIDDTGVAIGGSSSLTFPRLGNILCTRYTLLQMLALLIRSLTFKLFRRVVDFVSGHKHLLIHYNVGNHPFLSCEEGTLPIRLHLSNHQLAGVRAGGLLLLLGSGAALFGTQAPAWLIPIYLVVAATLPLLWPPLFGRWVVLFGLVLVAIVPFGLARFVDLRSGASPWLEPVLWLQLTAWLMLPATLALLLWRRRAAAAVTLLGMALMPVASLLVMQSGAYPTSLTEPVILNPVTGLALLMPLWLVMVSCCLGPLFFGATLVWLIVREVQGKA